MNKLNYTYKAVQVIGAGAEAYRLLKLHQNPETAEKITAACHILFAGAEIGNTVVQNTPCPIQVKFAVSLLTASLDIARTVGSIYCHKKEKGDKWTKLDTLKAIGVGGSILCFRLSDVLKIGTQLIDTNPSQTLALENLMKVSECIGHCGQAVGLIITIPTSITEIFNLLNKRESLRKLREKESKQEIIFYTPLQEGSKAASRELIRKNGEEIELSENTISDEEQLAIENLLKYEANLDTLQKIPDLIADDDRFISYRCPIAQWPLRFAVVPAFSNEELLSNPEWASLAYERREIDNWLKKTPNEAPPQWPENIFPLPLKREYFQCNFHKQREINSTLLNIIEELRETCLDLASKKISKN